MPNVNLAAVMDINTESGSQVAQECDCRLVQNLGDLLDSVDAVSIVVPTSLHREIAEPFLERGIPVLLEKPVAHTVEDARAIVELANRSKTLLQIGHLERFNAGVVRLAEELDRPRFMEVHRLGEFVARATDVDVVTDLMIHDIDLMLNVIQSDMRYISAVGARVITDHVDIANARLEFEDGAVVNVTASRVSSKKFRRIRIFAESCYLALNFEDQQIDVARPGPRPEAGGFAPIISESIQVTPRPPLDAELEDFVDCVRSGRHPVVDGEAGLRALQVAHEVRQRIDESLHSL